MIGGYLGHRLECQGRRVVRTSRRSDAVGETSVYLDLAAPVTQWTPLPDAKCWVLAAGVTRLTACRQDPAGSTQINVEAMAALAAKAGARGIALVFLSTDKVFDGSKPHRRADEPRCPTSLYGRQNAEAERRILEISQDVAIIRLTKVLARNDVLFTGWIEKLNRGDTITPFADMVMAPIGIDTVISALTEIIDKKLTGIFQVSGTEDISYMTAAHFIAEKLGAAPELVRPASAIAAGVHADDLAEHTSLDTAETEAALNLQFPKPLALLDALF